MQKFIKRFSDLFFAVILSVIAFPVILVTMLIIRICSPESPAIFKQTRVGYKGEEFTIIKIRTMTNETDEQGNLLPDELRLKKWGKIIRKLSIDELTQIIHIFKGEMSWIGPRPLLPKEMCVMTKEEQARRQSMRPGITGWEAVHEGESDTREEMAQFDLYYVDNWSLGLDLKILFMTVAIIFTGNRADDAHRAPKIREEEIKDIGEFAEKQ